jgi:hypothetical protein
MSLAVITFASQIGSFARRFAKGTLGFGVQPGVIGGAGNLSRSPVVTLPDRLRLPFSFDAVAIMAEAAAFPQSRWERHFNQQYYDGDWSGIALRSTGGPIALYSDPNGTFSDTADFALCPAVRAALVARECDLCAVRFLRLCSSAWVREHRDYGMGMECGEVRLHVPLQSGPGADFLLAGTVPNFIDIRSADPNQR